MANTCDMHIHTNYSDGHLDGQALLELAKQRNLTKLSITDHDCVDFYFDPDCRKLLEDFDYIPGCEFVCAFEDVPIEILGYGLDLKKTKNYLDKFGITQNKLEKYRSDNVPKVFAKYGIILDYNPASIDFSSKNPHVLEALFEAILSNPEAVEFLNAENPNLTKSKGLLLREGLNNPNSKIFIHPYRFYPTYEQIAKKIKELGGLSFLAHPYQYKHNMGRVLEGVKDYVDGVECYHFTSREAEKRDLLIKFCKKNKLMICGGSDFHEKKDWSEKSLLNQLGVPAEVFNTIKENVNKMHANLESYK